MLTTSGPANRPAGWQSRFVRYIGTLRPARYAAPAGPAATSACFERKRAAQQEADQVVAPQVGDVGRLGGARPCRDENAITRHIAAQIGPGADAVAARDCPVRFAPGAGRGGRSAGRTRRNRRRRRPAGSPDSPARSPAPDRPSGQSIGRRGPPYGSSRGSRMSLGRSSCMRSSFVDEALALCLRTGAAYPAARCERRFSAPAAVAILRPRGAGRSSWSSISTNNWSISATAMHDHAVLGTSGNLRRICSTALGKIFTPRMIIMSSRGRARRRRAGQSGRPVVLPDRPHQVAGAIANHGAADAAQVRQHQFGQFSFGGRLGSVDRQKLGHEFAFVHVQAGRLASRQNPTGQLRSPRHDRTPGLARRLRCGGARRESSRPARRPESSTRTGQRADVDLPLVRHLGHVQRVAGRAKHDRGLAACASIQAAPDVFMPPPGTTRQPRAIAASCALQKPMKGPERKCQQRNVLVRDRRPRRACDSSSRSTSPNRRPYRARPAAGRACPRSGETARTARAARSGWRPARRPPADRATRP